MSDPTAADILDWIGDGAAKLARALPGKAGSALAGVSLIGKAAATAIRARGESVADIVGRIEKPREVVFDWEKTPRPGSKKDGA